MQSPFRLQVDEIGKPFRQRPRIYNPIITQEITIKLPFIQLDCFVESVSSLTLLLYIEESCHKFSFH